MADTHNNLATVWQNDTMQSVTPTERVLWMREHGVKSAAFSPSGDLVSAELGPVPNETPGTPFQDHQPKEPRAQRLAVGGVVLGTSD